MLKHSCCLLLLLAVALPRLYATEETLAERQLRQIINREKTLLAEHAKKSPGFDQAGFDTRIQQVNSSFDLFVRDNPDYVPGLVAYGLFLRDGGMNAKALTLFEHADALNPNLAVVKNELGNFAAEAGRPLDARPYFEAALRLAPTEPLYHYQLGTLLYEARDDFLKSGESRARLDQAMQNAFRRAAELAPDNVAFAYRYAESFYDLATPRWDEALALWQALEKRVDPGVARQTIRLHEANVLIKDEKFAAAEAVLNTVTEKVLAGQKEKLVAQLPESEKK